VTRAARTPKHYFISYRRTSAAAQAGRLYDLLANRFGDDAVFMDIDSISPGADFVDAIEAAVSACDVLLVLIDPAWTDPRTEAGAARLTDPADFVRLEVGTALRRNIPVVPVLLNGATLPRSDDLPSDLQPLVRRQAFALSDTSFRAGLDRLIDQLGGLLGARDTGALDDSLGSKSDRTSERVGQVPAGLEEVAGSSKPPEVWTVVRIKKFSRGRVFRLRLGDTVWELRVAVPKDPNDQDFLLVNGERPEAVSQQDEDDWAMLGAVARIRYELPLRYDEGTVHVRVLLAYVADFERVIGAAIDIEGERLYAEGKRIPQSGSDSASAGQTQGRADGRRLN
jgi:hypothetical protein